MDVESVDSDTAWPAAQQNACGSRQPWCLAEFREDGMVYALGMSVIEDGHVSCYRMVHRGQLDVLRGSVEP